MNYPLFLVLLSFSIMHTPAFAQKDTAAKFEWSGSPDKQGFAPEALAHIETYIQHNHSNMVSMMIVRNSKIVYENYFHGSTGETASPVFSITKSITSALIGIAIQEGYIKSIDQKLCEFLRAARTRPQASVDAAFVAPRFQSYVRRRRGAAVALRCSSFSTIRASRMRGRHCCAPALIFLDDLVRVVFVREQQ